MLTGSMRMTCLCSLSIITRLLMTLEGFLVGFVETRPEMALAFHRAAFTLSELQQTFEAGCG